MATSIFRGKQRDLAMLAIVIGIVFVALGIYSLAEFLSAADVPATP